MHESEELEIVGGIPPETDGRSSVLTLEIPILPPPKTGMLNLEGERQNLLIYLHQADASLGVLQLAVAMLTRCRALATQRLAGLEGYSSAVEPEADDDKPIAF